MTFGPHSSISESLSEPIGSSPLVSAVLWLQNTLLGTIALTVAILAVASVGFMMLTGRVHVRYGVTVVAGCFVLFGAPAIVSGVQSAIAATTSATSDAERVEALPQPGGVVIPPSPPNEGRHSDPYAGASVPTR